MNLWACPLPYVRPLGERTQIKKQKGNGIQSLERIKSRLPSSKCKDPETASKKKSMNRIRT